MEYLPGWDQSLLAKLRASPDLRQISPFGALPAGVWRDSNGDEEFPRTKDSITVYEVPERNLTTTCVVPREVYDSGVR